MGFDHERLDVYNLAVGFAARADEIIEGFPRGRGYLADQLQRAALSIVLNIAEGAGKYSLADKASYYTRARGSTTECAAVLDVCGKLRILTPSAVETDKTVLARIAQMLTKLIKSRTPDRGKDKTDLPLAPEPEPEPGLSDGDAPPGPASAPGLSEGDTPQ